MILDEGAAIDRRPTDSGRRLVFRLSLAAALALFGVEAAANAAASPQLTVERVVMLTRHGVRAPLATEAGARDLAAEPFPEWNTPAGVLTEHGAEAIRRLAAFERSRLQQQGLLPTSGCPASGTFAIWTNSAQRTIATGHAWAEGLAPGCSISVDHKPEGERDPLFSAIATGAVPFDAEAAAQSINDELGTGLEVATRERRAVQAMEAILGCDRQPTPCGLQAMSAKVEPTADNKNVHQVGLVETTSGTAQVFLLQYAEGMPMAEVGWGRATPERIELVSRLHARLFDATDRSRYIAPRIGGGFVRRIVDDLSRPTGAPVSLIVGHDGNIAAVAALMRTQFHMPGYGEGDPPIGGGLIFELVRDAKTAARFVRLFYQAQTPLQVRTLAVLDSANPPSMVPLEMPFCGNVKLCPFDRFVALLSRSADTIEEHKAASPRSAAHIEEGVQ